MTTNEELNAFLAHHGVKGMRWGQRKASPVEGVRSAGAFTSKHPTGVAVTAGVAFIAYRKSGKIAASAVIASAIGGYEIKKHYENDPAMAARIEAGKRAVNAA